MWLVHLNEIRILHPTVDQLNATGKKYLIKKNLLNQPFPRLFNDELKK